MLAPNLSHIHRAVVAFGPINAPIASHIKPREALDEVHEVHEAYVEEICPVSSYHSTLFCCLDYFTVRIYKGFRPFELLRRNLFHLQKRGVCISMTMRFSSHATILFGLFNGAVSLAESFDPIVRPRKGETVQAGSTFTIKWQSVEKYEAGLLNLFLQTTKETDELDWIRVISRKETLFPGVESGIN